MTDLRSALRLGIARLAAAAVESPRLDSELLLAHAHGMTRAQLFTRLCEPLGTPEHRAYVKLLDRRAAREPLAYIVGHKPFYDVDLIVDRRVLIPRPETEHLVDLALASAPRMPDFPSLTVADVGTGSGVLAVALAQHLPKATVIATDCQSDALAVARANAKRQGVADRVRFLVGDLLAPVKGPFSLVVANLPYIPQEDMATLPEEIIRYEPRAALDGGQDGLAKIRRLLEHLPRVLAAGGTALLEIGAGQAPPLSDEVHRCLPGWRLRFHRDYAGHQRVAELYRGNRVRRAPG